MKGILGHDSELKGYTVPGTTWANERMAGLTGIVIPLFPEYDTHPKHDLRLE